MFDIGFMELVLIAIVSLIVIGPERLPGAVRTASLWIGRAKRSFNQVKTEIEREINADEIRRQLHNESILADLDKAKKKADALVHDARKNIDDLNTEVNATLKEEERKLTETSSPASARTSAAKQLPSILPPMEKEVPAPPEDDPARFDADYSGADTADSTTVAPEPTQAAKPEPVVDFYNNPPAGTIRLQNGVFSSVTPDDEKTDQQRKE